MMLGVMDKSNLFLFPSNKFWSKLISTLNPKRIDAPVDFCWSTNIGHLSHDFACIFLGWNKLQLSS